MVVRDDYLRLQYKARYDFPSFPVLLKPTMPRTPSTTGPSERFRYIFDKALKAYTKKTEKNLLSLPIFREIDACDSPEDILNKLRDRIPGFDKPGTSDDSLSKWLTPIVNVLYAFSATLGEGVGLVRRRKLNKNRSGMALSSYFTGILTRESHLCWSWRPSLGEYCISILGRGGF